MNTINCKHWSSCNVNGGGCCAIGLHGGKPSRGVCLNVCDQREPTTADVTPQPRKPGKQKSNKSHELDCPGSPSHGPGTELHKLLNREPVEGCDCKKWICRMNEWGPERCRERKPEIVHALMDSAKSFGKWYERAAAKLAPERSRQYVEGLVDQAIEASGHG